MIQHQKIRLVMGILAFVTVILLSCAGNSGTRVSGNNTNNHTGPEAKYVFLFIGDGFAYAQKVAAEEYLEKTENGEGLSFTSFPAHGITTTMEANRLITDSAAAGTAIATGVKTNKGIVGMDQKLNRLETIAELAKAGGRKVGIVTSVSIDHATPACFYAHQKSRSNYYEIARSLAESDFDYFGGGGAKGNAASIRKDREDILDIARRNGFTVAVGRAQLESLQPGGKVFAYNKRLDRSHALPYAMDYTAEDATLADFTRKGIELLDNSGGFFMMVEGGKIDWACHRNDAAAAVHDVIAFDEAVRTALDFYRKHPKETLIVVTGDHECGGMTIGFAGTRNETDYSLLSHQTVSSDILDKRLTETVKNGGSFDDCMALLGDLLGFGRAIPLNDYETERLRNAYEFVRSNGRKKAYDDTRGRAYPSYSETNYNSVGLVATHILDNRAGIGWSSYYHTGVPVGTYAVGSGSAMFVGSYDNTDIFRKLKTAMKL